MGVGPNIGAAGVAVASGVDRARVARLFHRAGFGATTDDIDAWTARGYGAAVDHLLGFPPASTRPDDAEVDAVMGVALAVDRGGQGVPDITAFQRWWLNRMATSMWPLEEKLALYWHGHFATGYQKVARIKPMIEQNRLLRYMAGGDFRALCKAITADPAMLVYLDGRQNRVNAINENYGREFMELFTLGHDNGYSQGDVVAAARSFTGYVVDATTGAASFKPALHDGAPKTLLGNTGNWGPGDVTDIVLDRHPGGHVAAAYVARRMAAFFTQPAPSDALVMKMADVFVGSGYQVKPMVAALLEDPEFMDSTLLGVKSPVELVASTIRALDLGRTNAALDTVTGYVASRQDELAVYTANMGQSLFKPPNVAGWRGGTAWTNTATFLARYNFAARVASLVASSQVDKVVGATLGNRDATAQHWMSLLGMLALSPDTGAGIDQYLKGAPAGMKPADIARGVLTLLIASPDYNLR